MGCTSSSIKYRDVYEELCQRVGFSPAETRVKKSSGKSIQARSNTFAAIGKDLDPDTGVVRAAPSAELPFIDAPKPAKATALTAYAKETWKVSTLHPVTVYLCTHAVGAVNAFRAEGGETADTETLARTEYRLWLLAVCEAFHVLAVLQEQKGMPKTAQKWLQKVEKGKGIDSADPFAKNGALLKELRALTITASDFNPKVLERLGKEFPGAISSNTPTVEEVLKLSQTYCTKAGKATNPLERAEGDARSGGDDTVPLFSFVEAVVVAQVLALCGPEEDAASYAKRPWTDGEGAERPAEAQSSGAKETCDANAAAASTTAHDGAEGKLAGSRGPYELQDLLAWGELLSRYDEIDILLATEAPNQDGGNGAPARGDLERERSDIDQRLRRLFGLVSKGTFSMGHLQAADGMRETFNLQAVFAGSTLQDHVTISDVAFDESTEGAEVLTVDDHFRHYLSLYINFFNMYVEARKGQQKDNLTAGVEPLTDVEMNNTLAVLPPNQQRHITLVVDPLCAIGGDESAYDGGRPFQPLFEFLVDAEMTTSDDKVPFDVLCKSVARAFNGRNSVVALRDLSELKRALGLETPGREGTKKSADFVASCCSAAAEGNAEGESGFVPAVGRKARLVQFAPFPGPISVMATHFAAAASEGSSEEADASSDPVHKWIAQMTNAMRAGDEARDDSVLVLSSFFAHTLYGTTAAFRSIWEARPADTLPNRASSAANDTAYPNATLSANTQMDHKWFLEAARGVAAVLGCQTSELLRHAGTILSKRPQAAVTSSNSGDGSTESNKATPSTTAMAEPTNADDAEATVLNRAFRDLAVADHTTKEPGSMVRLEDFVYVCLFNMTKTLFEGESLFSPFFRAPFPLDVSSLIAALLAVLPMKDEARQYHDFFLFSGGERSVPFDMNSGKNEALNAFIHAMYEEYEEHMSPIVGNEEGFATWFRKGIQHLKGQKGEFTARDYAALLEYLCAQFVAFGKYKGDKVTGAAADGATSDMSSLTVEAVGEDAVRRKFIEELILFSGEEEDGDGRGIITTEKAAEAAKQVFSDLQISEMETRSGDVSLNNAAEWYGGYRLAQRSNGQRSQMEMWKIIANEIPFTSSSEHRRARHTITAELHEEQKQQVADKDGKGSCGVGGDGYLVAEALVEKCLTLYARENIPLMPSCVNAESWLKSCVAHTNQIVGRTDLGDGELHQQDMRFFFNYANRDMTAYCTFQETKKEVDAVLQLQREGRLSAAACGGPQMAARAALERCLQVELNAPKECTEELLRSDCLTRFCADGQLDAEGLAHYIATAVVTYDKDLFLRAKGEHREDMESRVLEVYEKELLLGRNPQDALAGGTKVSTMSDKPIATYWERLRHLLPHGNSTRQRMLRQRLWDRIDIRGKGYVTLADLNRGLYDVLRLNEFRDDLAPVLFRAFFATTEMYTAQSDVVYLTAKKEQFLTPKEFRVFLVYLYSYMELYFMFDVLTCSGFLDEQMKVKEAALDPTLKKHSGGGGGVPPSTSAERGVTVRADGTRTAPGDNDPNGGEPSDGDVLFEAAQSPYAIMKASAPVRKQVTLEQFQAARRLLRHWGAHVHDPESVFCDINRRAREKGEMFFTGFAVWASEMDLHPEGYGHGFAEDADEVAEIETRLSIS